MKFNRLAEHENLVMGRGDDGIRTLGEMLTLAGLTATLAKEPLYVLLEQLRNAVEADAYVMVYRMAGNVAVPVGFFTLAWLSEPSDAQFINGFRALTPAEHHSGPRFRVVFSVFPYSGYFKQALKMLWDAYPKENEFGYLKFNDTGRVMHYMRRS